MWINTHSTIYFGSHYLKALPCFLWMSFIISSPWVDSAQMEPNRRNWEGCIREGGGKRGERREERGLQNYLSRAGLFMFSLAAGFFSFSPSANLIFWKEFFAQKMTEFFFWWFFFVWLRRNFEARQSPRRLKLEACFYEPIPSRCEPLFCISKARWLYDQTLIARF